MLHIYIKSNYDDFKPDVPSIKCLLNLQVSWSLTQQHDRKLAAWHNRRKTRLTYQMTGNRVALALDYGAGTITFSEVGPSNSLTHVHTFSTTFAQPVCLGFGLYKAELNSCISIVKVWEEEKGKELWFESKWKIVGKMTWIGFLRLSLLFIPQSIKNASDWSQKIIASCRFGRYTQIKVSRTSIKQNPQINLMKTVLFIFCWNC